MADLNNYPCANSAALRIWQSQTSSTDMVECCECHEEFDRYYADEDGLFKEDGEFLCKGCTVCCSVCGEYTFEQQEGLGPQVRYRDPLTNGKLEKAHADCAAAELCRIWLGERWTEDTTRERTDAAVARFGLIAALEQRRAA